MLNLEKYRCNVCGCLFNVVEDGFEKKYYFPEQTVSQNTPNTKCPSCKSYDSEPILKGFFDQNKKKER